MQESDETLVMMAQRGDRVAFEEIVRRTHKLIFARLYLDTGDSHRAEDLLQETLLRAWRSLQRLTDPAKLRPWLLTISRNVMTDAARRNARQKRAAPPRAGPNTLNLVTGNTPPPEEAMQQKEERGRVLEVLRSLPEEYRLPLTLRYISGADFPAIETQLGLTNGALRGLLHRGMKMMKAKMQTEIEIENE